MSLSDAPEPVTTVADYEALGDDALELSLRGALGALARTQAELAKMVVAADRRKLWRVDAMTAMSPWLVELGGLSLGTAREWVRVGRRLAHLPELTRVFSEGRLSWDQVAPATRLLDAEADHRAEELVGWTAAMIDRAARDAHPPSRVEREQAWDQRRLRLRDDPDSGGGFLAGFLPAEQYPTVKAELARRAELRGKDPETGRYPPSAARTADALFELCEAGTGAARDPQDAALVVHVRAEDLADDDTAQRLGCDPSSVEYAIEDERGRTVGIGRRSRIPPRWLRRIVLHRDEHCRFPGCSRPIRHLHHLRHWSTRGPTNEDNLVGLCWYHHRRVHEGGWQTSGDPREELTFVSPDGVRKLRSRPFRLRR